MNHFIGEPFEDLLVKGCSLRIVGTAHVSKASKEFVAEQVDKGSYDCVAVELCSSRFQQLTDPASLEAMALFQVIKQKRVTTLAVMLAMGAFQRRIAAKFDLEPGAERRREGEIDKPCQCQDRRAQRPETHLAMGREL